jgi:adenylosuccinate synthase
LKVAVFGLGFGDEGKGITTDWLASCLPNPERGMVVRFSGGPQCGHTVIKDGLRHIFCQFGSGTLRGTQTYYSNFCTFDPDAFNEEYRCLAAIGVPIPNYYLHKDTPIVTPFDIRSNRTTAKYLINGTVGSGHGSTLERETDRITLRAGDLIYPDVWLEKLKLICEYYGEKEEGLTTQRMINFQLNCNWLVNQPRVFITDALPEDISDNLIFEGSQGLLLDENIGFFPHVTRGNTSTKNLYNLIECGAIKTYYLVTRSYHTRHGNGPLPNEKIGVKVSVDTRETNIRHNYQGDFRQTILSVDLIRYALDNDPILKNLRKSKSDALVLVMTCLDRMQEFKYVDRGDIVSRDNEASFVTGISELLGIRNIYLNRSPFAGHIEKFNE